MVDVSFELITGIGAIIAVIISFVTFIINREKSSVGEHKEIVEKVDKVIKEFNDYKLLIVERLKCLETKWEFIEREMALLAKQHTAFVKDDLIDKYLDKTITTLELTKLENLLSKELVDLQDTKDNRTVAIAFILVGVKERLNKCGWANNK